ncbi:DUF4174 domain-containing protein [Algibacter mikhailovii]|nr:DUF4174 domain-containing protein [Algibacter mikhailovii]
MSKNKKSVFRIFPILLCTMMFIKVNGQHLDNYKWKNRILIVKTLNENSPKYKAQLKEFKNAFSELKERKLILFLIVGDKYQKIDGDALEINTTWKSLEDKHKNISDDSDDFEVVLIGLDGGIKLKKQDVLTTKELYNVIDRMPMRLNELKHKK